MLAAQAGLLEAGMELHLVDGRGHAGLVDQAPQVGGLKLETPIERTRPSSFSSMKVFHVST